MESTKVLGAEPQRESDILFCNDSTAELLTRRSITKEQRLEIIGLQALQYRYNWMALYFVAQWVVAGYVALTVDSLLLKAAAIFLMGCSVSGLPVLMHEACHALLHKNPRLNRWIGFFCGLPGAVAVSAYRAIHLAHHAHTRTESDPDDIEVSTRTILPLAAAYVGTLLIGIYLYIPTVARVGYQKANEAGKRAILLEYTLMVITYAAAGILVPTTTLIQLWLLPLFIAGQLSNVRGLAEHALMSSGNEFVDTRTVVSNRFVSFMMCNLNYHLEHHLFPGVPWYNLPKVHRLLNEEFRRAGASVYSSYTVFLVDAVRAIASGKIRSSLRLLPTHLREEICR